MSPLRFLRAGAIGLALAIAACTPPAPLKKIKQLPEFTLTERSGQPFSSASLKGKVWIADFFFTECAGTCPMLSSRLSDLHRATASLSDVRLVSISTDPEKDTPEVLQQYAKKFGADDRWFFLTGPKSDIFRLSIEQFMLALADDPGAKAAEKISHSTKLVLIDKQGWIRGYYDGAATADADGKPIDETGRLLADLKRLLSE